MTVARGISLIFRYQGVCESGTAASYVTCRARYVICFTPPTYKMSPYPDSYFRWLDDALSDDAMESFPHPFTLPPPELGNLEEIQNSMRTVVGTPHGRDALSKFVIGDDYIRKLLPLVETAEDLEDLEDLHHLCNIMKILILLNDTQIIEHVVSDSVVLGVVGALECKP